MSEDTHERITELEAELAVLRTAAQEPSQPSESEAIVSESPVDEFGVPLNVKVPAKAGSAAKWQPIKITQVQRAREAQEKADRRFWREFYGGSRSRFPRIGA